MWAKALCLCFGQISGAAAGLFACSNRDHTGFVKCGATHIIMISIMVEIRMNGLMYKLAEGFAFEKKLWPVIDEMPESACKLIAKNTAPPAQLPGCQLRALSSKAAMLKIVQICYGECSNSKPFI